MYERLPAGPLQVTASQGPPQPSPAFHRPLRIQAPWDPAGSLGFRHYLRPRPWFRWGDVWDPWLYLPQPYGHLAPSSL